MFNSPFDFFALLIAVVAFIFARKAFNQAGMLRARLDAIEATGLQARPGPPPLTSRQEDLELTPAAASPRVAAEQPEAVADAESIAPVAGDQDAAPKADGASAATPPPL